MDNDVVKRIHNIVIELLDSLSVPHSDHYKKNKQLQYTFVKLERSIEIYYREEAEVRVYIYEESKGYQLYEELLNDQLVYQKNKANPRAKKNKFAFYK